MTRYIIDATIIAAVRSATKGTYRFDHLCGPHMAESRAAILTAITGKKVAKSNARYGEVRRLCYELAGIDGGCEAERESRWVEFCRATMGEPSEQEEFEARYGVSDYDVQRARRVLDEIPGCSAAGMAKQLGCTETRGAELLKIVKTP